VQEAKFLKHLFSILLMVIIYKKAGLSVYQGRDWRKKTGKKIKPNRKKRKHEFGRYPILTKISSSSKEIRYAIRTKGGRIKIKAKEVIYANVLDPETKEVKKVKILEILENPSDRNLNRMKVITKNTKIETEIGTAVVTSRPGQEGIINAILLKEKSR